MLILFFYGIINHAFWIILGTAFIISGGGYWFYRKIKSDGKMLNTVIVNSLLAGKTVEVSLLGGIAKFKVSDSHSNNALNNSSSNDQRQLEAPNNTHMKDLAELALLYEKKLITSEEYDRAKQKIIK